MSATHLEEEFLAQVEASGVGVPVRQCREPWAGSGRRFRGDFCWPERRVLAEVDGATWSGGRHTRGAGYESDCVKANLAQANGWRVVRCTGGMVGRGECLAAVRAVLEV